MSNLEITATLFGIICVYLTVKESMWSYAAGFINAALFSIIFFDVKLYADAILQIIFIGLMAYGVIIWSGGAKNTLNVRITRKITSLELILSIISLVFMSSLWSYLLLKYTDASIPIIDSSVAMLSILAQYFMSRKVLESWIMWIIVDVVSIPMYFYKELYTISGLYVLFLILAIRGFYEWKKESRFNSGKVHASP